MLPSVGGCIQRIKSFGNKSSKRIGRFRKNPLMLRNAKSYNKKLQGRTKSKTEAENREKKPKTQQEQFPCPKSYDSKINHFSNLI